MLKNNIVIADGGSTKCRWAVVESGRVARVFETKGVNPIQLSADAISDLWRQDADFRLASQVDTVFYYGAGCIGGEPDDRITTAVGELTGCADVRVFSDMLGAARALFGSSRGVACILGTGCNSCLYDGRVIVSNVRPLGYILGDEGSGADIGKHIVADALKGLLPDDLTRRFFDFAEADYHTVIKRIYAEPRANAYLASFARFAAENIERPQIHDIVSGRFAAFLRRNVALYARGAESAERVGFVGGVAAQFEPILRRVCADAGVGPVVVERDPLMSMVRYHAGVC